MLLPHELYQKMSPELAAAGLAYLRREDRDTYKTGLSSLAIQRKLRPAFIQKRPADKQIEWMVDMLKLRTSVAVGEHILQTWLMKEHTDMLVMLLDKLEIDHDGEGSVEGELPEDLDDEKLGEALELILGRKEPEIVAVYLHMFKLQRPTGWQNLEEILETDTRLTIGGQVVEEEEDDAAAAEPEAEGTAAGSEEEPAAAAVAAEPEVAEPEVAEEVASQTDENADLATEAEAEVVPAPFSAADEEE